MGLLFSKQQSETVVDSKLTPAPVVPIDGVRILDNDPRSPTGGIYRTPIEIENTPRRRGPYFFEKNVNQKKVLDVSFCLNEFFCINLLEI